METTKTNFRIVPNTGTVAQAKQHVSGLSNNQYFTGTFTILSGVVNTAPTSESGHLYLGDAYNGGNDIYLYTCSDYGPASAYGNLTKGSSQGRKLILTDIVLNT